MILWIPRGFVYEYVLASRQFIIYIYVHISFVSSSINLNLYFHHLFFCRVVNHEEASQIRSKLRCQINRRLCVSDISGSALFETIPLSWNEEGLSYTFTRRIKTKNPKNISPLFRSETSINLVYSLHIHICNI